MAQFSRRSRRLGTKTLRGMSGQDVGGVSPDLITAATREDTLAIAVGALLLALVSLITCISRGYLLLYGDAVAHLAIARRIFDSRNPGLVQLGGVWLPLPHLLMLPFIGKMEWWQNGMAGAWPSLLSYIFSVIGLYRLSRWLFVPRWAMVSTAFYTLNPNLLYSATTALTEPLFLALLIWITVLTLETVGTIRERRIQGVRRRLPLLATLIAAAVLTRYDGWILGAVVWCVVTWQLFRRRGMWVSCGLPFAIFTVVTIAAPLSWLAYNQHFSHDPFDFIRGPYSAAAIEQKTSPPSSRHYRGWHNPAWAFLFYTRTAQVDAAAWETGFVVLAASFAGTFLAVRQRFPPASLLLWLPLPFYVYSIAYGSVPIFIPQLWPHSYYNSRYGMELLPAMAVFSVAPLALLEQRWQVPHPLATRLLQPVALAIAVLNCMFMTYEIPLVLKEGLVNATTRVAFETSLATQLASLPKGSPILMYNSDHVGALQQAGISLRTTLNEGDYDSWQAALREPAEHAAYVIAIAGDPVSRAVKVRPQGLTELTVLCTTGQPCARIYKSGVFTH